MSAALGSQVPDHDHSGKPPVAATPALGQPKLVVPAGVVLTYPPPPNPISSDAKVQIAFTAGLPTNSFPLVLLRGEVGVVRQYSLLEKTSWLIDMAHDICDPVGKAGVLWVQSSADRSWCRAESTDEIQPTVYEYRPPTGANLCVSKFSCREMRSLTSRHGDAAKMRKGVLDRDGQCWISQERYARALVNSHIVPKRMGDHQASFIRNQFCGTTGYTSVFDPVYGIALAVSLDVHFNIYELGFRRINDTQYQAHLFLEQDDLLGSLDLLGHSTPHLLEPAPASRAHDYPTPSPGDYLSST